MTAAAPIIVIGGGVAGCAAAVAAARAGARVVLVETGHHLGGAAAAGEHRTLCGLAPIDAATPELIEPELVGGWLPRLATGAAQRVGRVWLWPTDAQRLQRGLADGLRDAEVAVRFGAAFERVEIDGDRVVAAWIAGERVAVAALIDASGRAVSAVERASDAPQWAAHRSVLRLALDDGRAARVRALATARAALARDTRAGAPDAPDAAIALSPLGDGCWQLSLDVAPTSPIAAAADAAELIAAALGGELIACARAIAQRDEGRPRAAVDLATLFATRERGLCWAAWPRERHGPEGVAWTWPAAPRHGVPEAVARPDRVANRWFVGKALAVDAAAAAALRVTGTCLALGAAVGQRAAAAR